MPTMNISLPESMRRFVEEQIGAHGYSSASEYFRELVRNDQKLKAKEALETLLLQAMKEEGEPMTEASWRRLRRDAAASASRRTRAAS